jgi:hypothetical protein
MCMGQICSYDAEVSDNFLSSLLNSLVSFSQVSHLIHVDVSWAELNSWTVLLHRSCAMLQHKMFMYILVHITSWTAFSPCGHGVDCGSLGSYTSIYCVLNSTIRLRLSLKNWFSVQRWHKWSPERIWAHFSPWKLQILYTREPTLSCNEQSRNSSSCCQRPLYCAD